MFNLASKIIRTFLLYLALISILLLSGCYSFTGGSVPSHLKTLQITPVQDNSNFGNPEYRNFLNQYITERFESNGSFRLTDAKGDARLSVVISSIRESAEAVSAGELETDRRVTISTAVEYFDNVNKRMIFEQKFQSFETYPIAQSIAGRDDAVKKALRKLSEDILLAVVSGW